MTGLMHFAFCNNYHCIPLVIIKLYFNCVVDGWVELSALVKVVYEFDWRVIVVMLFMFSCFLTLTVNKKNKKNCNKFNCTYD